MIEDEPITIDGWTPVNSDRVYRGQITLREAFARSSNAATVRLSQQVGRDNVIRAARDLGITTPLPDKPSLALGTAGVSLLELTSAYAAVASGRYPIAARGLPRGAAARGPARILPLATAALDRQRDRAPMLDLLYAAANNGTGRRAALAVPTFGKTGTTQENRDALVRRLRRRSGGRRVGRPRRQQVARQGQRRHRSGRDLAQLHDARPWRSTCSAVRRCRAQFRRPAAEPRAIS